MLHTAHRPPPFQLMQPLDAFAGTLVRPCKSLYFVIFVCHLPEVMYFCNLQTRRHYHLQCCNASHFLPTFLTTAANRQPPPSTLSISFDRSSTSTSTRFIRKDATRFTLLPVLYAACIDFVDHRLISSWRQSISLQVPVSMSAIFACSGIRQQ